LQPFVRLLSSIGALLGSRDRMMLMHHCPLIVYLT
jgi:hypothetical protein